MYVLCTVCIYVCMYCTVCIHVCIETIYWDIMCMYWKIKVFIFDQQYLVHTFNEYRYVLTQNLFSDVIHEQHLVQEGDTFLKSFMI